MTKAQRARATKALELAISQIGSVAEMSRSLDVSRRAIYNWLDNGRINPEKAIAIEGLTSGQVSRKDLRPDLYK